MIDVYEKANLFMQALNDAFPLFFIILFVVLGGVFGSFLTCALYRIPRNISLRKPSSSCPSCKTKLTFLDLWPILSWLFTHGKCRHCGAPIAPTYVFIEILCVVLGVVSWLLFGPSLKAFVLFALLLSFAFVLLALLLEKTFTPKVLLFSTILVAVLHYMQ